VARARTWLAAVGWRLHGLISCDERPRGKRGAWEPEVRAEPTPASPPRSASMR